MSFTQHYTAPTVAQRLGISMKTLWRWIRAGRFGAVAQINGRYFISHAALERVVATVAAPAAPMEPVIAARGMGELKRKAQRFFGGDPTTQQQRTKGTK